LTPCVICDAPENDSEFAGCETSDGNEQLRTEAVGQVKEHPCVWCLTDEAEARWERRQAEEVGEALRALFSEECIGDLD
jgi:hypothetical protein